MIPWESLFLSSDVFWGSQEGGEDARDVDEVEKCEQFCSLVQKERKKKSSIPPVSPLLCACVDTQRQREGIIIHEYPLD